MHMTSLAIHGIAGSLGLMVGFLALFAAKGARLHRQSGMIFVYAMMTVGLMGAMMAAVWGKSRATNIPVGLLTAYLVFTALTTVRPPAAGSRRLDLGLMLVPLGICMTFFTFGLEALAIGDSTKFGVPLPAFLIFSAIGLLATAGDLRMIRSGGAQAIRRAPRLRRHLWRMCTALLIASLSIGQVKIIPKPFRTFPLLLIPPLVVLAVMIYWLWRVRIKRGRTSAPVRRLARASDRLMRLPETATAEL
jgi:uncharacterized membrane protein